MKKFLIAFALTTAMLTCVAADAQVQTPSPSPQTTGATGGVTANGAIGEVMAIDAAARQMFVKTDSGAVVIVTLADTTVFKRIPPGETTLGKAVDIKFSDVGTGDRVFARGKPSDDLKSIPARMVIVMSKADITAKQERERTQWRQRGIVGVVTALNPQTKEITLQTRGAAGAQSVVLPASDKVKLRRYAPDSIKFDEAKPATFEELKVGDQLRALGERSPDGARFTPEEIVTGSFRTVMGTVTAVDAATNEIKITTAQGNQPLTVIVSKDSMIRRITPEIAAMMAPRPAGGGAPQQQGAGGAPAGAATAGGGTSSGGGARPAGAAAASSSSSSGGGGATPNAAGGQGAPPSGAGGGGGGRMMADPAEMLERLPAATVADLKPGTMIAVSSTTGADPARVTAIQLVAGVEALMGMMQPRPGGGAARPTNLGTINLGFGIGSP